jgi:NADH dehydrogenase
MANILRVDPQAKILYLDNGEVPLKTIDDALLMRNALFKNLELAVISKDPRQVRQLLTIVVAGGGFY